MHNALLQWDAEGMPYSLQYGDIYYSKTDALGESSHVFIQGNALLERFAALGGTANFGIGELGFGAGLNFLNTCAAWCAHAPASAHLHYLACELHPFTHADMRRLLQQFPQLRNYADELLKYYPDHTPGTHQLTLRFDEHKVTLTLLYGDALVMLDDYLTAYRCQMDAWFLDGFAPRVNPGMWQESLLRLIARSTTSTTTLSSYSVSGSFRAALEAASFSFTRLPGFGGKRHMLQARHSGPSRAAIRPPGSVCIVGGGLAGCSTAHALAELGWQVTLIEQGDTLAIGGSGNVQGILHCKPATADTLDNHFNLHTYLHAQRQYSALRDHRGLPWHECGMLHIGFNAEQQKRFGRVLATGRYAPGIMRQLSADEASAIAAVSIKTPCLYFPRSGWLRPRTLCELYIQHRHITLHQGQRVDSLKSGNGSWELITTGSQGRRSFQADAVVLCNAADAYQFSECRYLPLISNRGQVDVYASSADTEVKAILCGQGYVLPSSNGVQSIGGSYYVEGTPPQKNRSLHLELLKRMQPQLAHQFARQTPLQQRVGQRCQTPDRMPLAGAVNAQHAPGLYINVGHGSNGLARTPLCAAYVASLMSGTPSPIEGKLKRLLDPARFDGRASGSAVELLQ